MEHSNSDNVGQLEEPQILEPTSVALDLLRLNYPPSEISDRTGLKLDAVLELSMVHGVQTQDTVDPTTRQDLEREYAQAAPQAAKFHTKLMKAWAPRAMTMEGTEEDERFAKSVKNFMDGFTSLFESYRALALKDPAIVQVQAMSRGSVIPRS